jgi:hypothetical protein
MTAADNRYQAGSREVRSPHLAASIRVKVDDATAESGKKNGITAKKLKGD